VNGKEPDFTNYAFTARDDECFIDTLDFLFLLGEVKAVDVVPLTHRDDADGPYPTASEPSDHVLVGATLEFGETAAGSRL
jgi:hypothetical protein